MKAVNVKDAFLSKKLLLKSLNLESIDDYD